jgi:hypothetical protein
MPNTNLVLNAVLYSYEQYKTMVGIGMLCCNRPCVVPFDLGGGANADLHTV